MIIALYFNSMVDIYYTRISRKFSGTLHEYSHIARFIFNVIVKWKGSWSTFHNMNSEQVYNVTVAKSLLLFPPL